MKNIQYNKHLESIFLIYFNSKIYLAESHLMINPKSYHDKFGLNLNSNYDLDILFFIITRSPGYKQLGSRSWKLFVIEITKILSSSKNDKYSILKLYNKFLNDIDKDNLECLDEILNIIKTKNNESVLGKLTVLRDQYYAHSDEDYNTITNKLFPTYEEIWDLMDKVELFLKSIYSQSGSAIVLDINRIIIKYLMGFKRMYNYYQATKDFRELSILKRNFSEERIEAFRKTQIDVYK